VRALVLRVVVHPTRRLCRQPHRFEQLSRKLTAIEAAGRCGTHPVIDFLKPYFELGSGVALAKSHQMRPCSDSDLTRLLTFVAKFAITAFAGVP